MSHSRQIAAACLLAAVVGCTTAAPRGGTVSTTLRADKPRVVVTTDPELDDANSLIRYLLFSTDFRTEGLVYASSQFHWKGDGTGKKWFVANREYSKFGVHLCPCESWRWAPGERFIDTAVETYEQVYPNLRVHDANYPTPADLRSRIRWGNVEFDGDISKDTPGSDLIKSLLLDDEAGPIYLLAWGGESTIARALKSIEDQYSGTPQWTAIAQKVSAKAIISPSGDQDDSYANYIKPHWPAIRLLPIGGAGNVALSYFAPITATPDNAIYYSVNWTRTNVSSRGPLGALYRVWGDGKQMVKNDIFDFFGFAGYSADQLRAMGYVVWMPPQPKGEFLGEGDSFTFLNLIDNGLRGYEDATSGGWGGVGAPVAPTAGAAAQPRAGAPNFTPAAQNAFAARLLWSVTPTYAAANHEPRVTLRGSTRISARAGETVHLRGDVSDPDGNVVRTRWWRWREADSYPGDVALSSPTSLETSVQIPSDAAAGQTIHLILEATDTGTPALTRYARAVITVRR